MIYLEWMLVHPIASVVLYCAATVWLGIIHSMIEAASKRNKGDKQ